MTASSSSLSRSGSPATFRELDEVKDLVTASYKATEAVKLAKAAAEELVADLADGAFAEEVGQKRQIYSRGDWRFHPHLQALCATPRHF